MIPHSVRNKIITDLYHLNIPEKVWKYSSTKSSLFQDFKQYCYLQICELSDEKLEQLLSTSDLANYFYILCKRQTCRDSHFFREHAEKLNILYDYEISDILEQQTEDDFE